MTDIVLPTGTTKAQDDFVSEYVRSLLVVWADETHRLGAPNLTGVHPGYILKAQEKGWLSKREPLKVSASGYSAAASYLRR